MMFLWTTDRRALILVTGCRVFFLVCFICTTFLRRCGRCAAKSKLKIFLFEIEDWRSSERWRSGQYIGLPITRPVAQLLLWTLIYKLSSSYIEV